MTDGDRQGVGGVVGAGDLVQAQQELHHALYLILGRIAITGHRLFDFGRFILLDGQPGIGQGQQGHPTRVSDGQRGTGILAEKEFFHGGAFGTPFTNQRPQLSVNVLQALC